MGRNEPQTDIEKRVPDIGGVLSAIRVPRRGALTLIELLVVIVILTTLVAAAIPVLSPSSDARRLREASRGVNTFITGAQSKAIASRRPFGVALTKLSQDTDSDDDNGVCLELYYVEQPPAFTGFSDTSSVRIRLYQPPANLPPLVDGVVVLDFVVRGKFVEKDRDGLPDGWDFEPIPPNMVRPLDTIEVNGTRFQLIADPRYLEVELDSTNTFFASGTGDRRNADRAQILARVLNDTGQMLNFEYDRNGSRITASSLAAGASPPPYWTEPLSYRLLRQPMMTSAEPYQLPEGIAIDLRASGRSFEGLDAQEPVGAFHSPEARSTQEPKGSDSPINNRDPIVLMFAPEGSVQLLRYNREPGNPIDTDDPLFDSPIATNIFLLIGLRENIPAPSLGNDATLDLAQMSTNLTDEQRRDLLGPINWLNPESRWVVIGSQSGRIVSAENAAVDLRGWSNVSSGSRFGKMFFESDYPLQRRALQIHGAREFARELTQMGGK